MTAAPEAARLELDRILASQSFASSERLSRFLRFTVEQALLGHGEQLKEYCLGVSVFDRDEAYDPRTDPIVRVEAGRLRSKLSKYYESEGRDDPVRIEFPRGSYVPQWLARNPQPSLAERWKSALAGLWKPRSVAMAVALLVAALALYWVAALAREAGALRAQLAKATSGLNSEELKRIWGPFLSSEADNTVVFGSPLFFANPPHRMYLRLWSVNEPSVSHSSPDFQVVQKRLGELNGPYYNYTLTGDTLAVQQLTVFFGRTGRSLKALPAHESAWDAIRKDNIILIGAPRMNPLLERLAVRGDFELRGDNMIVTNRNPQPGEQATYESMFERDAVTYALIASLPGLAPGREIMLLTAHSAPGIRAAVDYITRPEHARAMTEKLRLPASGERRHYQMLIRVWSDGESPVKMEYVTHHPVSGPFQTP